MSITILANPNNREENLRFLILDGGQTMKIQLDWEAGAWSQDIFPMKDPLSESLDKAQIDVTTVKILTILGDTGITDLMQKQPGQMAKLLEEIPETLPNLVSIVFRLPPLLPNLQKFLLYVDTYILKPFMGDGQPLRAWDNGAVGNIYVFTNNFTFEFVGGLREVDGDDFNWHGPVSELLLQKPNLEYFHMSASNPSYLYLLNYVFSSSSLEDLRLENLFYDNCDPENWVPELLAALTTTDCKQKGRRKKRKRRDIGFAGALYQLKKLQLESCNLDIPHLRSISDIFQKNKRISHLVLDKIDLRELHAEGEQEPTESQLWDPILDILRHNKTLTKITVIYNLQRASQIPYGRPWERRNLYDILVDWNHKITSISFGYNMYKPCHPDNTQLRLDLNYFGLGRFGTAAAANANHEGFPRALLAAVQKDKTAKEGDRKLIPCLFQLISNNPSLLINNL